MAAADMGLSEHCARRRTAASRVHPAWGVVWEGKISQHNSRVLPAADDCGRNGRGVVVGCLQQHQVMMGFHSGYKSSGMAARTSGYAAAKTAAGEVMERTDLVIISSAGALRFGNIGGAWGRQVSLNW